MTLFLLGFAAGVAGVVGPLAFFIALDKRQFPDCVKCQTPLPPGHADKLCPRCRQYTALVKHLPSSGGYDLTGGVR